MKNMESTDSMNISGKEPNVSISQEELDDAALSEVAGGKRNTTPGVKALVDPDRA